MPAKWVQSLLKLQANDLRIRDLEQRMKLLPSEMNALKAKRDQLVASTAAAAEAAHKVEREIKSAESEIARLTDESRKLQQQSAMVKKNTEYQAMLNTVALNKNKIGKLEGDVIELLDKFEEAKAQYRKIKAANDAAVKSARAEFEELIAFAGEIKQEIARLQEARPALIHGVDSETLSRYNTLLKGRNGGIPLVKIDKGICGNCHLRITPQAMNGIQKGVVTYCDNCQHIIYDEEVSE